ncbi:c-type cytochrome [Aerophototrophica crusticola]|uniref:C-type cytochrome n=1 Tax=Aerophototrophica crusticola TaxID=1709002 RepID=A0A858RAT7_9PROT|nr:c-type cytochrome [Rhodospirillaceae bacterium B3]
MKAKFAAALLAGALSLSAGSALAQGAGGDAAKGEAVFKKCQACHRVGPDAKNLVGPVLNGVVGRKAGTAEGYKYSDINHAASEAGLIWTEDALFDYLADPSGYLKKYLTEKGAADKATGNSKMVYKLANEQERKDVIAFLATKK